MQLATNSHQVGQWSQTSYHSTWNLLLHSSLGISHIHQVIWWQFTQFDMTLVMLPLLSALLVLDVLLHVW